MIPFHKDIIELTKQNTFFRQEVMTGQYAQVVLMNIDPRQDIGEEVHKVDQILIFVEGQGEAILNGKLSPVNPNDLVFVPAGTRHNFRNTGGIPLKLYTIYAPPQHKPGTVHKTKSAAAYEELISGT